MDDVVAWDQAAAPALDAERLLPELYRQHRIPLLRLGVLLLEDQAAAEDVVQDVFSSLWRRRTVPQQPGDALAYLRRAVVNRSRSHMRKLVLARRRPPLAAPNAPSALEIVEMSEERRRVLAALHRLPRGQREVLVLRYYSDLPVSAVADALRVGEGTVKSQTARGLAALARMLEDEV